MKNKFLAVTITLVSGSILLPSCKDSFLEQRPQGVYDLEQLTNKKGVNGLLISAYAALDGNDNTWYAGASNWVWGSVAGGDALKGSEQSDQVDVNPIMTYAFDKNNPIILNKWNGIWDGVGQANQVLKVVPNAADMSDAEKLVVTAEARFLRAFHHFEGKKVFNNIPYVDETVTDFRVPNVDASGNYINIWPQIEADLQFAYDNLPAQMANKGRVNKWAAGAFLAKAYMFQKKFTEAKALFDAIIGADPAEAVGTNAQGQRYKLAANFHENFRVTTEMNPEIIFSVQASYGDGATRNGNYDNALNYPHGTPSSLGAGCCGFFQPTQTLVNSYKTNAQGLPDINNFNATDVTSDAALLSTDAFTPYAGTLDPRLDHTVGRRGIPYLDWGVHPGRNWIRKVDFGGPYAPKKHVFYKSDIGATAGSAGWGWNNNALNYPAMRYADLLLMAAEAEIEVGMLEKARTYINLVRARANNSKLAGSTANYLIGEYPSLGSQAEARDIVRFERKLELAMEGHRFFDLVRWGIAAQELNNVYLPKEKAVLPAPLTGAAFTPNKHEYYPIPEFALIQSRDPQSKQPTLEQNPGYPQ